MHSWMRHLTGSPCSGMFTNTRRHGEAECNARFAAAWIFSCLAERRAKSHLTRRRTSRVVEIRWKSHWNSFQSSPVAGGYSAGISDLAT